MSAMNIDRPLEEMITEKNKNKRRGTGVNKRGGKGGPGGAGQTRNARPSQPRTQSAPTVPLAQPAALQLPAQTGAGSKIIVSNLPTDVTENQIRELFATTVGYVNKIALSYDQRGMSKGVAQVEFRGNGDATKAFQQYNKRLIDASS